jgi:hypothetical protein
LKFLARPDLAAPIFVMSSFCFLYSAPLYQANFDDIGGHLQVREEHNRRYQ